MNQTIFVHNTKPNYFFPEDSVILLYQAVLLIPINKFKLHCRALLLSKINETKQYKIQSSNPIIKKYT